MEDGNQNTDKEERDQLKHHILIVFVSKRTKWTAKFNVKRYYLSVLELKSYQTLETEVTTVHMLLTIAQMIIHIDMEQKNQSKSEIPST